MGSLFSKYTESDNEPAEIQSTIEYEETAKSAPISTPNRLDPRSPSSNIARTPLELILYQKLHLKETPIGKTPVVFGVDPRSPTTDFQRTPIVIVGEKVNDEKSGKLVNKNLENVRRLLIESGHEVKVQQSSENQPKLGDNKRKSIAGVLETNIDFTETNIDEVFQEKLNQGCIEDSSNKDQETDNISEESRSFNITDHVRDFSKKLTTLIYEDKTSSDDNEERIEKLPKLRENNRTPLGVRCTNTEQDKKIPKLKVSDKPKSSRIPVYKDIHCKKNVQCENTPPTTTILNGDKKIQQSKWDKEATLII